MISPREQAATSDSTYTHRLLREETTWWKRALDVRGVYGWNLRRLHPGHTLDVGCGLGRNLVHLGGGVGVDHNRASIEVCRQRGLTAYTPEEFAGSVDARPVYDSMLLAHVVEHMSFAEATELAAQYVHYVKPGGQVIVVTPQEFGFRADPTHVEFYYPSTHEALHQAIGSRMVRLRSFPLPHRVFGRLFRHNEYVSVGRVGAAGPGA
jgi:2-polyprenyl-3-methyl-5-hydroxy-6-metoxy-1,4-benzoquinol methylase